MPDLISYILIVLLIYAVRKWWKWRDRFIVSDRYIRIQKRIIKDKDFEIACRDEVIGQLKHRRNMEKDILSAQLIE